MGKSQETFNKKEREKKRQKKNKEKKERREQRKLEKAEKGKLSMDDQMVYLDENGNLVSEKPDPNRKKVEIKAEDIKLGAAPVERIAVQTIRRGKVKFFSEDKGYGFITDKATKDSIFVHINDAYSDIKENHIVEFEVEQGHKGNKAVKVIQVK